jgi:hypothetical protein
MSTKANEPRDTHFEKVIHCYSISFMAVYSNLNNKTY